MQSQPVAAGRGRPNMLTLRRALAYLGHYRGATALAYLYLIVSSAAMLVVPQLVQRIIDAISNGAISRQVEGIPTSLQAEALSRLKWTTEQFHSYQNGAESALIYAGLLIVVFAVARGLFAFGQSYMAEKVSQSIAFDFRNDLYTKIQKLSFSYHDRTQTGQLMVRATDDVEKVRMFVGQGLMMMLQSLIIFVATLIILFLTNARLTLVILPILPAAMLTFMLFGRISQPLFMEAQVRLSRLNTVLQENLAGIRVVKAFVREPQEQARFNEAANRVKDQQLKIARIFTVLFPFIFLLANLGQAAIQYFGGGQIIFGTLTFGEWQKFSLYLFYVFFPLGQLGFIITQLAQAAASADRIFEIIDAKSDVQDVPGAAALPSVMGRVEFENVSLSYFGGGDPVLRGVSFAAAPGQRVALLGATGSGKTSIINLIPRFYDVTAGRVLIDGHDIREVKLESLRGQIGIVLQDTTLFSGTVRDNIAFGKPEASDEEVRAAAQAAAAAEFIEGFPRAYDTPVGERGTTLSGGQKQRIAIARALLMDPRILILDDSTSSVDLATERQIQTALDRLMLSRTSFVIAQRLSTVRNADLILVLDKGQIVASGRHEELLEDSPTYAEIYHSQLLGDAEASAAA